jgi:GTPase
MAKFTDTITIRIKAGDGGPGAVSFMREKYIPKGGPDGGDGGRGGDVYFEADRRYYNLSHFFRERLYRAENGKPGSGSHRSGKSGEDLVIKVPPGTQIIDQDADEVLADLVEEGSSYRIAEGGTGGKGNAFFKSSTLQTPRFSQPGIKCEVCRITLNLKLIADIGLVGLPNAGKSTLLSKLTNAKPKIGDYPFTTLTPNLGIVEMRNGHVFRIADIPGIIEGAHRGQGLGLSFLQHIERVKIILFMIDSTESDPAYNLSLLKSELNIYNKELINKPYYIILTKSDLVEKEYLDEVKNELGDKRVLSVSSVTGKNLEELIDIIDRLMGESDAA